MAAMYIACVPANKGHVEVTPNIDLDFMKYKGMSLYASVYMCFVVTCWESGILGQVWYLIESIPDLCILTYFPYFRFNAYINTC